MAESEPQPDNDSSDGCFLRHEDKKSKELYSVSSSSEGKVEDPLKFPPKPEEPLQSDCCGTGCTPCVFDIYDQELRLWEKECKKIRLGVGTELAGRQSVISPDEYRKFEIIDILPATHDSWIYRFRITGYQSLGLHAGQHIILREGEGDRSLTRQYTPISDVEAQGYFDVLIKIYSTGRMSAFIKGWQIGQCKEWRGPFGKLSYSQNTYRRVVMLAAGTGIAPMMQLIQQIVQNEDDETFVRLVYASKTYADILLKSELDQLTSHWNFTVLYVLSQENAESTSGVRRYSDQIHYGRVDSEVVRTEVSGNPSTLTLICGTKSFDKDMIKYLKQNGLSEDNIFKF